MVNDDLYLVIGCFGRRDDDFISCAGLENRILKIDSTLEHYNEIMEYFENCRLFDRPMFELQAIRHFIFNIRERYDQIAAGKRIWAEKKFELYQKFIIDHRLCGLYLKLILVNPEYSNANKVEFEEKSVFIKSEKPFGLDPQIKNPLRLIRGRK